MPVPRMPPRLVRGVNPWEPQGYPNEAVVDQRAPLQSCRLARNFTRRTPVLQHPRRPLSAAFPASTLPRTWHPRRLREAGAPRRAAGFPARLPPAPAAHPSTPRRRRATHPSPEPSRRKCARAPRDEGLRRGVKLRLRNPGACRRSGARLARSQAPLFPASGRARRR
ncbi:hypothetical protein PHLGIDRAFT_416313 [Phlebiopsis gigantea 11061_1 CR5-6]|uniref:Uncharacterized protein n=1 Tax=Phlebiopsis gigantea (strain 11061_1 CR5-6) TaxID=745531 RepID=A0A0C3S6F9_PHLG1|nr:hypothetical protein PHLGIDRAFT_416313 [Phlebiopsis gigantea 11061_1 CR5-6]